MYGSLNEPLQLDPELHRGDGDAYRLAVVVANEVESVRSSIRESETPQQRGVFAILSYASDSRPWYEYATDIGLLFRVSERLAIPVQSVVRSISDVLTPANWQVFFWMSQYFDAMGSAQVDRKRLLDQFEEQARISASHRGRLAANAKHEKPGGAREKQAAIREIWASGRYPSRDECAEQECSHLNMSFSAARKALRGTGEPIAR